MMSLPRSPVLVGLTTAVLALLIYGLTLAPDLTWANQSGDGPELITAAMTLGVPHPPGYPTYTLLGYLFGQLPLGTVAFRFNLFSAVGMAVAAGFVAAIVTEDGRPMTEEAPPSSVLRLPSVSIAVGLSFALAPLVWSQATVAEVYGLYMALLAAMLWAVWRPVPNAWLCGGLLGLAVTAHLTALFWLPLVALKLRPNQWLPLAGGLALGLTPFLALPWLAQSDGPLVWGRPETLDGWWWLVTARIYHPNLLAHGWAYSAQQAWQLLGLLVVQFTPLGLLLVGYGVGQGINNLASGESSWFSRVSYCVLRIAYCVTNESNATRSVDSPKSTRPESLTGWLLLMATAVAHFIYAAIYHVPDYQVFLLPALLPLALLLYPALRDLARRGPVWLPLLLPLALLLLHFSPQNLRQERQVRPAAVALLEAVPPDAIVLTPGDQTISTLWYFQAVEGQRPDLVLVDHNLFGFDWYRARLGEQFPFLAALDQGDPAVFVTANQGERPFCHARFDEQIKPIVQCEE